MYPGRPTGLHTKPEPHPRPGKTPLWGPSGTVVAAAAGAMLLVSVEPQGGDSPL